MAFSITIMTETVNWFMTYFTTVKPVFSDYKKQDIILAFQTGGCLLLHESSTESSGAPFIQQ